MMNASNWITADDSAQAETQTRYCLPNIVDDNRTQALAYAILCFIEIHRRRLKVTAHTAHHLDHWTKPDDNINHLAKHTTTRTHKYTCVHILVHKTR